MIRHVRSCIVRLPRVAAIAILVACGRTRQPGSENSALASDSTKQATTSESPKAPAPPPALPAVVKPHIDALIPDSVRVPPNSVAELVIRGSGFEAGSPGRNTVVIGPIRLAQVPANSAGTEIRVVIPDRIVGQVEAPPRPVLPGAYAVSVETTRGTSNFVNVRILP